MMLTSQETNRYDRHLRLEEIGIEGQEKLKAASVLVIGAGGLGCPVLQYLAAAGVGHLGIVDDDVVDESNLQRQVLFGMDDLGKNKASVAAGHLMKLNPMIKVEVWENRLTALNALDTLKAYDLVLDCSDNFATRYLINDACLILDKPLVYGAVYKYEGQVAIFNYPGGPSYRCLFPDPPTKHIPNCAELGVLGVLPGVIGTLQASEALKLILGLGDPLSGKMLIYHALEASFTTLEIPRNETVIAEVRQRADSFDTYNYEDQCGIEEQEMKEVTLENFYGILERGETWILDVRESWEMPRIEGDRVLYIPVSQILQTLERIPRDEEVIVACQHGVRSRSVVEYLTVNHDFKNLINLRGGLTPYE